MRKSIKKLMVGALALAVMATTAAPATLVQAKKPATEAAATDADKPVKLESQKVAKVTCTASGKVNVSFKGKVTYTDALSASIKDAEGNEIACKISKKNKALLTVTAAGLVKGQKYTLTIEGVQAKNATEAATITKVFTAKGMKTECKPSKVKKVNKSTFILSLKGKAYYKDATVTVVDEDGNAVEASIIKKAKGTIKIKAASLVKGKKYTVTVTGIKTKKEKNFSSITKTFTAK